MNKYLIAAVMAMLVGVGGYSQRSDAAACAQAAFSTYLVANFSCDIGDKTFSNFSSIATTGADVGMVAVPQGGPFWGFNFFTPNLVSNSAVAADILFGYTVTCNGNGGPFSCIISNELTMVGGGTGTGAAQVNETICLNSTTVVGCSAANSKSLNVAGVPPGPLSASTSFAAVHQETVLKDANVRGGTNGNASISSIINTVDQVPEPASLALLGAGLFSLAALRRRKTRT